MKSLKAGKLSIIFDKNAIRYITYNGIEIVRNIYAAVRDKEWNTIVPEIKIISELETENTFEIVLHCIYKKADVHFEADLTFSGNENNEVFCAFKGTAFTDFYKCRVGFCVLHPIKESIGKKVVINSEEKNVFPEFISANQPFFNITTLDLNPSSNVQAKLEFDGDIFETEDQRNWSDASFKTYCTPLSVPFPAKINAGQVIEQHIKLSVQINDNQAIKSEKLKLSMASKTPTHNLPKLGLGRNSETTIFSENEISLLKALPLNHYRVDVKLIHADWKAIFKNAIFESQQIKVGLEIALFLSTEYESECVELQHFITENTINAWAVTLFIENEKVVDKGIMKTIKDIFKSAIVGTGTDAYFAELNRNFPATTDLGFVSYAINPQVHAFDNQTLVENVAAQSDTVLSAKQKAGNAAIHVSPITLLPRFNPAAQTKSETILPPTDARQYTAFAAAWTLGSIKHVAEAGANSVTYFETTGKRGLIDADGKIIAPTYDLLKCFSGWENSAVIPVVSNKPLAFDALLLFQHKTYRLFIANYSENELEIEIDFLPQHISIQSISGNKNLPSIDKKIHLNGYEICFIVFE